MFTKLKTIKKFNNEIITIQQLHSIVKNNPQKEYITYVRGLEYKSKEYNNSKLNINCITPHGIFVGGMKNDNLSSFSGYLFYDIDGIDTIKELNDTIKRLCDSFPISFLQRSVSYKGFHFLIKVDDAFSITNDTFSFLYDYVRDLLIKDGFNIDLSANGLSRKMIISSDEECLLDNNSSLLINDISFNEFISLRKSNGKIKISLDSKVIGIIPNDTFSDEKSNGKIKTSLDSKVIGIIPNDTFSIIPIKDLLKEINIETKYVKEIEGEYIIEDMEFYTILLPEIIKDGTKHRLFTRIVNGLYFINGTISRQQVLSYLFYVNNRASKSMDNKYLFNFITRLCDSIEQNGVRIKPRIKRIHFNEKSDFTKKEKQIMGARVAGNIKTNKSIKLIRDARTELLSRNEKDTQKEVQKLTGLGIATIKRNWNKEISNDILIPEREQHIKEDLFTDVISEEDFFNIEEDINEEIVEPQEDIRVIEHNYKGIRVVTLILSKRDKEDFRNSIQRVKENGLEVCLSTLSLCGMDKYKLEYLYNIWLNRQN